MQYCCAFPMPCYFSFIDPIYNFVVAEDGRKDLLLLLEGSQVMIKTEIFWDGLLSCYHIICTSEHFSYHSHIGGNQKGP